MTIEIRVSILGQRDLDRVLSGVLEPEERRRLLGEVLKRVAIAAQDISKLEYIIPGGPKGAPPVPHMLTNRTGDLRRSIRVDFTEMPSRVFLGSDRSYAPVHEFGGTIQQHVREHTRTVAFGRRVRPFKVGAFDRTATYPARPFLRPAIQDASERFALLYLKQELGEAIDARRTV